jgi:hypothetical protein
VQAHEQVLLADLQGLDARQGLEQPPAYAGNEWSIKKWQIARRRRAPDTPIGAAAWRPHGWSHFNGGIS